MPPWRARGLETVVVDRLGSDGKWRNLRQAPAGAPAPAGRAGRRSSPSHPPIEMVFHLGAISETTATDGDLAWATNVELPLRLWRWCAARGVRLIYASSAATYGDGRPGSTTTPARRARAAAAAEPVRLDQARLRPARRPDARRRRARARRNGPG